jgi:hypothetical protein
LLSLNSDRESSEYCLSTAGIREPPGKVKKNLDPIRKRFCGASGEGTRGLKHWTSDNPTFDTGHFETAAHRRKNVKCQMSGCPVSNAWVPIFCHTTPV